MLQQNTTMFVWTQLLSAAIAGTQHVQAGKGKKMDVIKIMHK